MSSSIFFRFKSQKESQRVQFDGTSISVWEAKREIITLSKLGDGTDFDLAIYNADSNEEYDDDTTLIPRSTTVIARRLPAAKPGQGRAARYVSGRMPVNARNSHRVEASTSSVVTQPKSNNIGSGPSLPQTEEERIAAMFAEGSSAWKQQKEQMATQIQAPRPGGYKPANAKAAPDHPPPPGYLCYRCGEKGHWIQACPTNNDPSWEGRPRVKRTTGIPKSQLKTIEKPKALTNDGLSDDTRQPSGVMVNADGEYVVAVPDQKSWEQYQTKAQASAEQAQASQAGDKELEERGLQCPIDKRLFVDPVKTPCCGRTYCNECIDNALANSDLVCPGCSTADVLIDDVIPDQDTVAKIKAFEEEKRAEKAKTEKAAVSSPKAAKSEPIDSSKSEEAKTTAAAASASTSKDKTDTSTTKPEQDQDKETLEAARSVSPAGSNTSSAANKRKASEDISTEQRIPTGPKAMRAAPPANTNSQVPVPPGFDASFVEQMNKLAGGAAPSDMPGFSMDMAMPSMMPTAFGQGMNGMNGMNGLNGMNGMNPGMNPGLNPGMNQGMNPGMNQAMMMNMMNPMMMQQMGMGNMSNFGMGGSMNFNANYNNNANGQQGYYNDHNNQHWNNYNNTHDGSADFNGVPIGPTGYQQNSDEDAYMRKPVNPGRYQGRIRKPRAADFKEL